MPTDGSVNNFSPTIPHIIMPRKEENKQLKDAKRERLIIAAVKVFAQKGFHATKMQDIADLADVGKGTLYEYFKTKDELFLAVYDKWMDDYEAAMSNAATAHLDPVHTADALIDTTIDFYEKHAAHAAILLEFWAHALRSDDSHFLERIREMKKKMADIGARVTQQLIRLKAFSEVDVYSFARLELGISDGIFLQWILDGQAYSLHDAYKFRQSVIGSGLMTTPFRKIMSPKTNKRLKEGYLKKKKN